MPVVRMDDYFGVGVPGIVPSSPGGTAKFLRADGAWAEPPGGGGGGSWGSITGTLADQTDLQNALDSKASIAAAAFTTLAPTSAVAATTGNELVRYAEYIAALGAKVDEGAIASSGLTLPSSQSLVGRWSVGGGQVEVVTLGSTLSINGAGELNTLGPSQSDVDAKAEKSAGAFDTVAPTSAVAATAGNELVRYVEHAADIAGRQPLDSDLTAISSLSTQAFGRSLLTGADRVAVAKLIGCPWVQEQATQGSAVGASSTARQTMFSLAVPGNAIGLTGRAMIEYEVEFRLDSGAMTMAWQVGGADVWNKSAGAFLATGVTRFFSGVAILAANGSTSAQRGYHRFALTDESTSGTGTGGGWFQDSQNAGSWADGTADTTLDVSISLDLAFGTSNANHYFRLRSARLVIEPEV